MDVTLAGQLADDEIARCMRRCAGMEGEGREGRGERSVQDFPTTWKTSGICEIADRLNRTG